MSLNVLREVESTSSKNEKIEILTKNNKNKELAELLDAALNFKRKFFIRKFDMPATVFKSGGNIHSVFMDLLQQLETRVITGHAARDKVVAFFELCDENQQLWYKRILLKDLKSGFTSSTANKSGFKIPKFDCKLAKDKKVCKKLDIMLAKGGFRSYKFDGYRCIAEIVDGFCTLYSRNGIIYENFPMINEALEELYPTGKHMLDGEVMSDDFQSMQSSAFATKRGSVIGDMKYHIFDKVPWDEWRSKKFTTKASIRFKDYTEYHTKTPHDLIEIVEHEYGVWTDDEMMAFRDKALALGHEGEMWEPDIPYYIGKKSNKMLKYKLMETMEVVITGFYEGKEDTKLEGSLGGFKVTQEDGHDCEVGTMNGMTHEDRQYIWDNQDKFLGRMFEAEYQEIGSKGKMRFPVFMRWRDDKSA